jgi:hypothetical protein
MTPADRSRAARLKQPAATLVLVALAAAVLLLFPPTSFHFYPKCPIYSWFHVQCPGCGATHALAAVLHGQLVEALRLNALVTLMLPLAAVYFGRSIRSSYYAESFRWRQPSASAVYAALAIAVIFTVARNHPL